MSHTPESAQSDIWYPVSEVPLNETSSADMLAKNLTRLMSSGAPGFVVRKAAGKQMGINDNTDLAQVINFELNESGYDYAVDTQIESAAPKMDRRRGNLHVDTDHQKMVSTLHVHTTTFGQGAVLLAESGPKALEVLSSTPQKPRRMQVLRNHMLSDETLPSIILPVVHTAYLETGDHIIFPQANTKGPIWHRFDNGVANRTACVTFLEPSRTL